jgi:hypothetical protein
LDYIINATPTSQRRNKFTEANLFLMQAREAFDKAKETPLCVEHKWVTVGGFGGDLGEQCKVCGESRV